MKVIGSFCGYSIVIVPTVVAPKLSLSDEVTVSAEFRREFDQWSMEWLGVVDITPISKGHASISDEQGVMYIRKEDWPALRAKMESINKEGLQL